MVGETKDGSMTFSSPKSVQVRPPSVDLSSAGQMYAQVSFSTTQASDVPKAVTETTGYFVFPTAVQVRPPSEVVSIRPLQPLSHPFMPKLPTTIPWSGSKNAVLVGMKAGGSGDGGGVGAT